MEKGAFIGRFQPFCIHHLEVLNRLANQYPNIHWNIGVADWQGEDFPQGMFLTGPEAVELARISFEDEQIEGEVYPIPIGPDITLVDSFEQFIQKQEISAIASGSGKSQLALRMIQNKIIPEIKLFFWEDRDNPNGRRARDVRNFFKQSELPQQHSDLTPKAWQYLRARESALRERLKSSSSTEKRPWKIS